MSAILAVRSAGAIDEDIETAIPLDGLGNEMLRAITGRHVAGHARRFAAGLLDPGQQRIESLPIAADALHRVVVVDPGRGNVGHHDDRAVFGQTLHGGRTNAILFSTAGNQC